MAVEVECSDSDCNWENEYSDIGKLPPFCPECGATTQRGSEITTLADKETRSDKA